MPYFRKLYHYSPHVDEILREGFDLRRVSPHLMRGIYTSPYKQDAVIFLESRKNKALTIFTKPHNMIDADLSGELRPMQIWNGYGDPLWEKLTRQAARSVGIAKRPYLDSEKKIQYRRALSKLLVSSGYDAVQAAGEVVILRPERVVERMSLGVH